MIINIYIYSKHYLYVKYLNFYLNLKVLLLLLFILCLLTVAARGDKTIFQL